MQYYGKVSICGVDTSKLPRLSNRETDELIKKIKAGDRQAEEKFIYANLRLVLSVVQRFLNRSESADDLFQVGSIGLIKAVKNFDLSHNVRFSTYAVPMMCTLGKKKGTALQNGRKPSNIKAFGVFYSTSTKRC